VSDVIDYFTANRPTIISWLGWHAWLSVVPVVVGLVIAVPLGWLARRHRLAYGPLVSLAGLLYTIPSLALFVLMPVVLHTQILDPVNVIVALTVYSVALLVRVVADGLRAVPEDVEMAARAMGYGSLQRLFAVELPVAIPVIVAGLRVATVSNVSLVSVAALLGVPQLGQLFTIGFSLVITAPIVLGIIGCVLLAVVLDVLLVTAGRLLTPWRRAVSPS
jgi:osmoprotectant transport system permease protein